MAAVFPIPRPHAIAAGLRYKAVAIALAASALTALIRLPAPAPRADRAENLQLPPRFTGTFLGQPPITKVAAVALEGISRNTCVMALGRSDKLSVGFGELTRDTIVSLVTCDLYDASREAESTELLSGARLKTTIIDDVDDPRVNPGIPEHVTDGVKSRWRARLPARSRVRRR